ncbi:MipA/OmpV family protein, partial [Sphingomonadaceae bacterium]|nr:MipA/OmpV family protein [Sphingomonadaceae bacterium]
MINIKTLFRASALALASASVPAMAQDATVVGPEDEETVFDGDWVSIGLAAALVPSYDGSDDYTVFPLPLIQGQLGPVGITPRNAGVALDFIPATEGSSVDFDLGIAATINLNRATSIEDPVVELTEELDVAFEVGPTVGVTLDGVLNPFDGLTFSLDARFDVAGAHDGTVIEPTVTYFTPLSRGIAASLAITAEYGDSDYNDYYFTVDNQQALDSGLPLFEADSGFNSVGALLLLGVDLDGDLTNGGLAGIAF